LIFIGQTNRTTSDSSSLRLNGKRSGLWTCYGWSLENGNWPRCFDANGIGWRVPHCLAGQERGRPRPPSGRRSLPCRPPPPPFLSRLTICHLPLAIVPPRAPHSPHFSPFGAFSRPRIKAIARQRALRGLPSQGGSNTILPKYYLSTTQPETTRTQQGHEDNRPQRSNPCRASWAGHIMGSRLGMPASRRLALALHDYVMPLFDYLVDPRGGLGQKCTR
jgi:hypothetical protein